MGWPADVPASAHLFVATAADLADAMEVDGEDGHHLARVLRLRAGETVTVADGSGTWRPYLIATAAGAAVHLEAAGPFQREPVPTPLLAVAFALTKGDKPDLVVQKLTELGVDRIVPVLGARSVSRPGPDRAGAAVERWRRIAREAARQCRRATLPVIGPEGGLADPEVEALKPWARLNLGPHILRAETAALTAAALLATRRFGADGESPT
jgi:16S rRNA (uracil1498-N3)-methyltransferase